METCDVLVIGHGLAGAAVAYEMQPFASVVLVERAPESQRPVLLTRPGGATLEARLAAASRPFYEHQANALVGRPIAVPLDLLMLGSAAGPDRAEMGDDCEPVEAAEILDKLPFLASPTLQDGLLVPDALDLDTDALHAGYRNAFTARGGRLVTCVEPIAIEGEGDGAPWRINAGPAKFEANVLVDAAGPLTEEVAVIAGVPPLGLLARRQTTLRFEAEVAPPEGMPAIASPPGGFLLKPEGAAFVAVISAPEVEGLADADLRSDGRGDAIARVEAETQLRLRRVLASQTTFLVRAPDGAPVVGHDDLVPGFFWVTGEGQEGLITPALARAAARLLVSGVLPEDLIELKIVPEDLLPLRFREQRGD